MPTIYIENRPYQVPEGQNMLHACLSLGFDLPYFCWHPGMHSVGACRQCAIKQFKDENDAKGKIVMACMLHATDGTRVSIRDTEAAEFRAGVTELLMTNHPHDCPVCDEGGECHLQDMTVMTGHNLRRYRFGKRTHRNQYLGPFIAHEMNRCIACYRCVRFYQEYAGGHDLNVFQWHNNVYFGRHEDGVLESEFSGNLVEVCPTGVFTDKTLKQHYTRKWDLSTAPSVCVHCSAGCNTIPGERYGKLRRIRNRYNGEVNGYWLCDRGRFGYEFVNDDRRLRRAAVRGARGDEWKAVSRAEALQRVAKALATPQRVIGIGSPRASLEANYALRTLVGDERFYCGMSDHDCCSVATVLEILRRGPARSPSLAEMGRADATLILGEDISNTAPMAALKVREAALRKEISIAESLHIPAWQDAAVREAIQHERGPLYVATPVATRLDQTATDVYRGAPADIARIGLAVARELGDEGPAVDGLSDETVALVRRIAADLRAAERPLIVSGTGLSDRDVLNAAAEVAAVLCNDRRRAHLSLTVPECNSLGMGLMGGTGIGQACARLERGEADTVVILENDLYRRTDASAASALLKAAKHVIVLDHLENRTMADADIVLPVATFAEGDGTLVNQEGRAQRFYQVFVPEGDIQESWRWLRDAMNAAGRTGAQDWSALDDISAAIAREITVLKPITEIAAPAQFRIAGEKIPRQPHRYSGRTAMHADVDVHEPMTPADPDSPLAFSMEGSQKQPPASLITHYWAPGWNSVQALNKFQEEVGGPLRGGDPGRRLIEPEDENKTMTPTTVPEPFSPQEDRWLAVPLFHVFGSEELSALAPGVSELAPQPYVALSPQDAERLQVDEGDALEIILGKERRRFPVKLERSLRQGMAGMPANLPETAGMALPDWYELRRPPHE